MRLFEMMDKTPLPGQHEQDKDDRTYLTYMREWRPEHFQGLMNFLDANFEESNDILLSAISLGADMFGLQILKHGLPEDLPAVYGRRGGDVIWTPGR